MNIERDRKFWLVVCLGIIGFGVVALFLMSALKSEPEIKQEIKRTLVIDAKRLNWSEGRFEVSASGRVAPVAMVSLQVQVSGDVVEVSERLQSGAYFKANETLLKINPATFAARNSELIAQLASAKADLKLAHVQFTRSEKLFALKATAQEELDQRQAALDVAKARIKQLEASIKTAKTDLDRSQIKAPFNGRVISEQVSVGDVLAPGVTFAEIYSTDAFEVSLAFSETDAVLIENLFSAERIATPARVEGTFGGTRFFWPATVARVEAGLERTTRTVNVIVQVHNPESPGQAITETNIDAPPLLSNMFVQAFIPTRDVGRYAKVDADSIRPDNSIWFVKIDEKGFGIVESAEVKTLNTQQATSYIQASIEQDAEVFVLGSDIGGVLLGNRVQVRMSNIERQTRVDTQASPIEEQSLITEKNTREASKLQSPKLQNPKLQSPKGQNLGDDKLADDANAEPALNQGQNETQQNPELR